MGNVLLSGLVVFLLQYCLVSYVLLYRRREKETKINKADRSVAAKD